MCKANSLLEKMTQLTEEVKVETSNLRSMLSKTDKEINLIYHSLEQQKFNACQGYYFSKNLQDLLRKRRVIKNELNKMETLTNQLKVDSIKARIENARKYVNITKQSHSKYMDGWNLKIEDFEQEYIQ